MQFDLIVIGSGPGGYRAAVLAAQHGLQVAIVEKADWGGCDLNRGSIPKNAWHYSAKLIAASVGLAKRGVQGALHGDLVQAWEHQKKLVKAVRDDYISTMKQLRISGFAAQAAFVDANTISLDGRDSLSAQHFIVATGASTFVPKPFSLTDHKVLTSDELFTQAPPEGKRVAIVGSGAVATEFAFILAMLGKEVIWISQSAPLANSHFSPAAQSLLLEKFKLHGIEPQMGNRPEAVEILPEGVKLIWQGAAEDTIVDWVLLGTGRRPHTTGLNLDAAGVNTDSKGFIKTNEFLQTTQPSVYAVGDVANQRMTANQALADAQIAVANILQPQTRKQERAAVPEVVYSALELARIGVNASTESKTPAIGLGTFKNNPRALGQDAPNGFVRLVADAQSGVLLSGEAVGPDAGELVHIIAQHYGQPNALQHLAQAYYSHPTRAEEIFRAAAEIAAKLIQPEAQQVINNG